MSLVPGEEMDALRKRLILLGLSIGAGFALAAAVVVGGYLWYESHPKPWNPNAIKATFDSLDTEGDDNMIVFNYTLQNTTGLDYRAASGSQVSIAARLRRQESLNFPAHGIRIDYPIFVPSHQRAHLSVHVGYRYSQKGPPWPAPSDELKEYRARLLEFVGKTMANLNGFVLFDDARRYQIELPRGW
jgi:hypothetical protein